MTAARLSGVVVDTMVISWLFTEQPPFAEQYRALIGPRPIILSFQTVMEVRFGALRARWGELRRRRLDHDLAQLSLLRADDDLATVCAELRHRCQQVGHALADKIHDGDRWVAASAILTESPVASHDAIFENVPGLALLTAR